MDDIADLVGKAGSKKYFYGFRNIIGEFMVKETGLMEQRKLENKATLTNTFKLILLCINLAITISVGLEWAIDNTIANLIITIKTSLKPLVGGDTIIKIESQERSDEIGDIGRSGSSAQRRTCSKIIKWHKKKGREIRK
jgi:methyl-accepting chemotaxis protein